MDVHTLTKEQKQLLSKTLDTLNNGNNYYFNITGYTDYVASEDYNMKLAKKRADIIKDFIKQNYPQLINSINTSAHGELVSKETLVQHNAKKGDLESRRVDVVIMFAEKTGYIPLNPNEFMGKPFTNVKPGDSIELKNLHFVLNTTNLEEESQKILDTLVQELKNHKSVQIRIEGHVCCGDVYTYYRETFKQKQMKLSKDRANAVFNYLVVRGIRESRLSYIGYGFKKPKVYPEKTEEDKAANRRVMVKITYL
ncbi:hypothetical protein NBRC110019_08740 [Neptunitalea chrysea]|uniref:OmpA-like domain-containing protein n=2 Tax=Neptunitalea chrysea TaxID=1647581 RepID=A0A9W6B3P8_9FLAO|nr:hypothetical protein NBRC110019_08740 [Neptunitalea chrysea]